MERASKIHYLSEHRVETGITREIIRNVSSSSQWTLEREAPLTSVRRGTLRGTLCAYNALHSSYRRMKDTWLVQTAS